MKRTIAAVAATLSLALGAAAQQPQLPQLYKAGMYERIIELAAQGKGSPQERAYTALSALQLNLPEAYDLARGFLSQSPEHILAPQVRFQLAMNLFDAQRYGETLQLLDQLSTKDIQPSQQGEYAYKRGYCAYAAGEWELAKSLLQRFRSMPASDYTAPAAYTLGYINYAEKDFATAAQCFEQCAGDQRFAGLANYYILECRFNLKDYDYVIKHGEDLFSRIPEDRQPHMARIMSESYLVKGDIEKARRYYKDNLENSKAQFKRSDYFYAGEIAYVTQDWQGAVDAYTQMGERTDSLGQVASYQLAYSYIRLKNKVAALEAFQDASKLDYNPEITEDAFFNYSKLAFDLNKDTAPFQEYLQRYGGKDKGDSIYSYMAMVALQNHDYEAAVDAYDHVEELDPSMRGNYMKAYFLRSRELMEAGAWRAVQPKLKAAAYYSPRRDGFNQLARYYLAEACYRDGKYAEARSILNDLYNLSALSQRPEGGLISYQMAYTYFKEKDYARALKWFQNYLEGSNLSQAADAQTRIADCYFFQGDYPTAVAAYERQMAEYPAQQDLYPRYRAGVASGLMEDNARKAQLLEPVKQADPLSPWYGESLYELGRAYVALNDPEDAARAFKTLRSSTPDTDLASRSLLELAMIARNQGRSDEALNYYKDIVAQGGDYADDALLAIESLYKTRQDPDAYLAYVESLGDAAQRTDEQKEQVYFSSAEQVYMSGDYAKAQSLLSAYLERYPQASFKGQAQFYLADCYRAAEAREQAVDSYEAALESGLGGALQESALLRLGDLALGLNDYAKAYKSYMKLSGIAQMPENKAAALTGRMRSAYRAHQWEDAIADAGEVLQKGSPSAALAREAHSVRAKSYLGSSQREKAIKELEILAQEPSTDEGAEATYLLIQDRYDRADFAGIQDAVYDFSGKAGGQNYYLAKAFIVLGDCFAEQGNLPQAKATFESLRDGYTPFGPTDDVPDQVKLRLNKL